MASPGAYARDLPKFVIARLRRELSSGRLRFCKAHDRCEQRNRESGMDPIVVQVGVLVLIFLLAIILGLQIQITGLYRRLEELGLDQIRK